MAIAELFIGVFITVLFEKLASGDLIKLARFAGIHSELNKWGNTLTQIQAVLEDAGQKHIKERAVQLWLNKLQHLAYEIDDVLDDLATEAARYQVSQESNTSTSKVLKFIPTKFHAVKYGLKMKSKLDEITTKLGHLVEEKSLLGLNDNVERSGGASKRLEETSLVDESKVIGRESDKHALLGNLLSDESSSGQKVNVVSIVGLGGIGKTTLAKLLYNDKNVKDHFEIMSWVCVSDEFDVFKISQAIFKDVGGDDRKFDTLNQLQVSLAEKLSKKRFLLVLDDVWSENYNEWELLQRPFTVGAPGSKILVTTRKTMVASLMDSVKAYPLQLLSNVKAISLFAEHALGKQNFDSHPTLKLYGEGIVKKCDGLPLALITIGRLLRTKSNDDEWDELLNSELWSLHNGSKILPALRLSYYDLPSHLKQMFTYCCLFPKDYMFDKDELVLLWMGEGFLYELQGDKTMESFGRECFEELVSRSFFQHSAIYKSRYTMHDMINDLARSVAGEFFFMLGDKIDVNNGNEALEKLHYLSFIREEYGLYKKFKALQRARRIRTFLATSVTRIRHSDTFYLSNKVLIKLLPQLQFLRVLSLAHYSITDVPESIGGLKHLRYLNFSNTSIRCLPEQVGDLHNLQSLLLSNCPQLSTLPKSIVKLINLRHLNITNTPSLNEMPLGLGRLTSLETLSRVIIGGSGGYKISDLKSLSHLRGQLSIERMHEVKNAAHAKEVNLQQKKGICDLEMKWSDVFDGSRNEITEYEVLEELRPFEKLSSLKIVNYSGTKFPSWVGDPSFICLTQLTLRGCIGCTCLPTLGDLPSLQKLFVESMPGLKSLGSELHGSFNSLEVLEFKDMNGWEEWSTSGDDKALIFPCLLQMSIISCPKLDVVAIELIPSLKVLHVESSSLAVVRSMVGVSSSIFGLKLIAIRGLTHLHGDLLKHLKALKHLDIHKCNELTYLWESEVACEILVSLHKLGVSECENLVSLGEKDGLSKISLESVRKVDISDCPRLKNYTCPNIIETLEIERCPSVKSLTFPTMDDQLQSPLKNLTIGGCDNVEQSWLLNNVLSSLAYLKICNMPNLIMFPGGCLVHLRELIITGCDNIESIPDTGYGFLPSLCLRHLVISNCKNLKSFPQEHLQSLTSLELMGISYCPSMNDSFPCGLWPPNLSYLGIGGLKKPIIEWGQQNFPTSLVLLQLYGGVEEDTTSFAKAEEDTTTSSSSSSFLLPPSLTCLSIEYFIELESISEGLQHLKSLEQLKLSYCLKLRDLPETLLPKLSRLEIVKCRKLRKKCDSRRKGKYWPIISQIPDLRLRFDD